MGLSVRWSGMSPFSVFFVVGVVCMHYRVDDAEGVGSVYQQGRSCLNRRSAPGSNTTYHPSLY